VYLNRVELDVKSIEIIIQLTYSNVIAVLLGSSDTCDNVLTIHVISCHVSSPYL